MVTDKMVEAARTAYSTATGCDDTPHVLDGWIGGALRAALEAALSASDAEPVCTVAEISAGGYRMLAPYPLDAINHLPVGTPLYADPPAVAVKALEWNGMECRSSRGDLYSIHRLSENVWVARKNGTSISDWHGTEDAAKAAAQADYETSVRAALVSPADTSPVIPEGWHLVPKVPTAYLVKRYSNDGVLFDTELSFTRPIVHSTARTEFEPLYLAAAPKESSR